MKTPAELGGRLCGILSACWSDSYPTMLALAEALEQLAAQARRMHAEQLAKQDSTRIIG